MLKNDKSLEKIEEEIKKLIRNLEKCDDIKYPMERGKELKEIRDKLIFIGKSAVTQLIEVLNKHKARSSEYSAEILGEIGDRRAIIPLVDALEEPELGESVKEALKEFGSACIPEVIKKIEYRIAHPIREGTSIDNITGYALSTIGEIKCDMSINFLNKLLDDYISEMPKEVFDPTKCDWKYVNVDFFHLLDCMVRQQDKRAIPHIRKARDFFPKKYTEYKICMIAIGRIKKGKIEGYLPLETLEIAYPSGAIMNALSGGEFGWKDTFDEDYGEYFEDEEE